MKKKLKLCCYICSVSISEGSDIYKTVKSHMRLGLYTWQKFKEFAWVDSQTAQADLIFPWAWFFCSVGSSSWLQIRPSLYSFFIFFHYRANRNLLRSKLQSSQNAALGILPKISRQTLKLNSKLIWTSNEVNQKSKLYGFARRTQPYPPFQEILRTEKWSFSVHNDRIQGTLSGTFMSSNP